MISNDKPVGLKLIAFLLVVTLFTTLIPSGMVFGAENGTSLKHLPVSSGSGRASTDFTESNFSDDTIDALFEDVSLRTPNSKTLRQNDGTYKLGTYSFEVHFPTSEGYVEYDNTLILKDGRYSPMKSDADIFFSDNKPEYSVSFGGTDVSFSLVNKDQNKPAVKIADLPKSDYSTKNAQLFSIPKAKAQIEYKDVFDGVTFSYLIYGKNIKESIVLESMPKETVFRFLLKTEAEIYIDEDGNLQIGKSVIPHAFMTDSAGKLSDAVDYDLSFTEEGTLLSRKQIL